MGSLNSVSISSVSDLPPARPARSGMMPFVRNSPTTCPPLSAPDRSAESARCCRFNECASVHRGGLWAFAGKLVPGSAPRHRRSVPRARLYDRGVADHLTTERGTARAPSRVRPSRGARGCRRGGAGAADGRGLLRAAAARDDGGPDESPEARRLLPAHPEADERVEQRPGARAVLGTAHRPDLRRRHACPRAPARATRTPATAAGSTRAARARTRSSSPSTRAWRCACS